MHSCCDARDCREQAAGRAVGHEIIGPLAVTRRESPSTRGRHSPGSCRRTHHRPCRAAASRRATQRVRPADETHPPHAAGRDLLPLEPSRAMRRDPPCVERLRACRHPPLRRWSRCGRTSRPTLYYSVSGTGRRCRRWLARELRQPYSRRTSPPPSGSSRRVQSTSRTMGTSAARARTSRVCRGGRAAATTHRVERAGMDGRATPRARGARRSGRRARRWSPPPHWWPGCRRHRRWRDRPARA